MIDFETKFPKDATNAAWQKAKSFKDKTHSVTKTGLGPVLDEAQKAWDKIPWKHLDFRTAPAKDMKEAKANLERAKTVKGKEVSAAITALGAAVKKAGATKANKALSSSAVNGAASIENKLLRMKTLLEKLSLDDLASEITRLETEAKGANTLTDIELHLIGGGHVGDADKGVRNDDGSVVLAKTKWDLPPARVKSLVKLKMNVRGKRLDGSLFTNDMTISRLSSDGTKVELK